MQEIKLAYAGEPNTFAGELTPEQSGELELQVISIDTANANIGMDVRAVQVESPE